jgi:hypothetical protein
LKGESVCFSQFFFDQVDSQMNYMWSWLSARSKGDLEGYADSRFFWTPRLGSRLSFGKIARGAYYTGGFGRNEDAWVEEASLVLYPLSHGERIGGPDHTMGGQGAKRTDGGDVVADTGEAGDGTGDRYGTSPSKGKNTGFESE